MNSHAPTSPPPGAVPGPAPADLGSPDVQSMMNQLGAGKAGQSGQGGAGSAGLSDSHGAGATKSPRPIGTPVQEAKYIAGDVAAGALEFVPKLLRHMFQPQPTDTPEEAAHKQEMLQNYQKLNAEQQKVVQEKFAAEQEKKRHEQEELMEKKKAEQQAKASSFSMPTGRTHGAGADGAVADLNKKRQQLSDPT